MPQGFEDDRSAYLSRIATSLEEIVKLMKAAPSTRPAAPANTGGQRSNTGNGYTGGNTSAPTVFPNYGRSKGERIAGAAIDALEYYLNGAKRTLGDPDKSHFHDKERALLAVLEAELASRSGGGGQASGDPFDGERGPPPPDTGGGGYGGGYGGGPSDEDIPF